ncbi:hypothetical protein GCM10010286_57900 [Streptomyces toxytricini]|nr:hypothetical protein GCM10010286_57900 [Streptomyces toxytricini]
MARLTQHGAPNISPLVDILRNPPIRPAPLPLFHHGGEYAPAERSAGLRARP